MLQQRTQMLIGLLCVGALLPALEQAPVTSVDRFNRASVRAFYNTEYAKPQAYAINWTGDVDTCDPGTVDANYRNGTVHRVNFFRMLVGLPAVGLNTTNSAKCQDMALMIRANNALSHTPPTSWDCYTADGAEAAGKSNLARGIGGHGAISLYMDDPGAGNEACGHRRWILYPRLSDVGSGSTPNSNALWVITTLAARPATPSYVAWPNEGYAPIPLLPGSKRWNVTIGGADFASATVSMTRNGSPVSVNVIHRNQNFADRSIGWTSSSLPTSGTAVDGDVYAITINNIGNWTQTSLSYQVIVMDPSVSGTVRTITINPVGAENWDCSPAGTDVSTGGQSIHTDLDPAVTHTLTPVSGGPG